MRTLFCSLAAAVLAVSLVGCIDDSDLTSPEGAGVRPSRYEGGIENPQTTVTTGDIALLDIHIRGADFESTLRYQIPLVDGQSANGLGLPIGSGYEVAVRGYDRYGEQTFEGERAEASFTLTGEERAPEGLRLVIEADRREIGEGQSAILRAYGVDGEGRRIELDPMRLNWSIDDPRHGRFDLGAFDPRDPKNWMTFNAHRFLEEKREARLLLTFADFVVSSDLLILKNGFVEISAGGDNTCALRRFGDVSCWGLNDSSRQLGIGSVSPPDRCRHNAHLTDDCSVRPMTVSGNRLFSAVSVGWDHACAIEKTTRAAFCWGNNVAGQTGVHTPVVAVVNAPTAVNPPAGSTTPLAFQSISAGRRVSCGVTTTNEEYCWGAGVGDTPKRGWGSAAATAVTGGNVFSCRMDAAGIWCDGSYHPIPGNQAGSWKLLGEARTAKHVCAIDSGDKVWCWGDTANGKLGNGTAVNNRIEVLAPTPLNTVATGLEHSCGLSGVIAYCWGSNSNGQLGINVLVANSFSPFRVTSHPTTPSWVKISTGRMHTCAIDVQENAWCWGENHSGQLGIGTKIDFNASFPRQGHFAPVRVVGL